MKFPPPPPYIQPLGRRLDFGFCLDQKFAIAATSRTSFVFNDQTKASQNPPSLIKLSSFIRNIQIAILVSCLFFVCSQETGPRGQVDRAPAWSITLGSWFSDC